MTRARTLSSPARDAARILGLEIARARRQRSWTIEELAERAGVSHVTVRAVERGAVTTAIGTYLELAVIVGVPLFGATPEAYPDLAARARERLALLPARVRQRSRADDDDF